MLRRLLLLDRIILAALAFSSAAALAQTTAPDPARQADIYAIYSLMLTNPQTSHSLDNNHVYLIAGTTVPGTRSNSKSTAFPGSRKYPVPVRSTCSR